MRVIILVVIVRALLFPARAPGQSAANADLISVLKADAQLATSLGLAKLSPSELAAWNALLNRLLSAQARGDLSKAPLAAPTAPAVRQTKVYVSKIDDVTNDVVKLRNGAIVEVVGYYGYVGYAKDAVLFQDGSSWKLWIEGKKAYRCSVIRPPTGSVATAERVFIREVKGSGELLLLADGRVLEVSPLYRIDTGLWIGASEALLIDGYRLINMSEPSEIIDVSLVR